MLLVEKRQFAIAALCLVTAAIVGALWALVPSAVALVPAALAALVAAWLSVDAARRSAAAYGHSVTRARVLGMGFAALFHREAWSRTLSAVGVGLAVSAIAAGATAGWVGAKLGTPTRPKPAPADAPETSSAPEGTLMAAAAGVPEDAFVDAGPEQAEHAGATVQELRVDAPEAPTDAAWLAQFNRLDDLQRGVQFAQPSERRTVVAMMLQETRRVAASLPSQPAPADKCGAPPPFADGDQQLRINVVKLGDGSDFLRALRGTLRDHGGREWLPWTMQMTGRDAHGPVDLVLVNRVSREVAKPFCDWLACGGWTFSPDFPCALRRPARH